MARTPPPLLSPRSIAEPLRFLPVPRPAPASRIVVGDNHAKESMMPVRVQIVFYSMYGHVYRMAEAVAQGVREVQGAEVSLYQVPELLPDDVLAKMGAKQAKQAFAHVPVATVDQLPNADAIIFGAPTRYGNVVSQVQSFIDATGQLWLKGSLIGKVGSVFTSTAT